MERLSEPQEWTLSVRRTARYYTLGAIGSESTDMWFVCHGYGQRAAAFLEDFASIAAPRRLVVAPEGLSRFYLSGEAGAVGTSWMTRDARESEIDDYVEMLDAVYGEVTGRLEGAAARLTVLGFSQGTATVCRWVGLGRGRVVPARVILWGGGLVPDGELARLAERLASVPFILVAGDRDQYIDHATREREIERFRAAQIALDVMTFNGGHRLDRDVLRRLADG